MRSPLLIFLCIPLLFCSCSDSPTSASSDSTDVPEPITIPFKNWVNVDYVACIDTSCPCECWHANYDGNAWDSIPATMITLDSINGSLTAKVYLYNMDHDVWTLTANAEGNFEGRRSEGGVIGTLLLADDLLLLEKNGDTSVFICYPELEAHKGSAYVYHLNAYLLKNTVADSDTLLRSLFALDSTTVSCSPEMGNVLTAPKLPVHKKWILYPRGENIALYQYVGDGGMKREIPREDTVFAGSFPRK